MGWETVGRMWELTTLSMRKTLLQTDDDGLAGMDYDDLPPAHRGRLLIAATEDGWDQRKYQEVKRALSER